MRFQLKKEWVIPSIVGIVSFAAGGVTGYIISNRRNASSTEEEEPEANNQMQLQFDFERQEMERVYGRKVNELLRLIDSLKDGLASDIQRQRLEGYARDMHEHVVHIPEDEAEEDEWDYEIEVPKRDESHPYIIHHDEYLANENDWSQTTLTYYAGDNILCDEEYVPIYNPETIVGPELLFGHGSLDQTIVFIRNSPLQVEYEVQLEPGKFQSEVLGVKEP